MTNRAAWHQKIKLLTNVELEVMNVIWKTNKDTAREVLGELQRNRKFAYTSVATMLNILEDKGYLSATKVGRQMKYVALITRQSYQEMALLGFAEAVFDKDIDALLAALSRIEAPIDCDTQD